MAGDRFAVGPLVAPSRHQLDAGMMPKGKRYASAASRLRRPGPSGSPERSMTPSTRVLKESAAFSRRTRRGRESPRLSWWSSTLRAGKPSSGTAPTRQVVRRREPDHRPLSRAAVEEEGNEPPSHGRPLQRASRHPSQDLSDPPTRSRNSRNL
jgi:hypothetical protein